MLRRLLKILGVLIVLVVVLAAAGYVYVSLTWQRDYSSTPLPAITATTDPTVIARGEYIAHSVAHCSACHGLNSLPAGAAIDWSLPLTGGYVWEIPLFGRFVSANITPDPETGIGALTDGELARAVRHAVDRDGHIMPFMLLGVGPLSDEDLTAVVSWLRSRPAMRQQNQPEAWGFMAKALAGSFTPRTVAAPPDPGPGVTVERGKYLASGPAACFQCHTSRDQISLALNGVPFAGNAAPEPDAYSEGYEFAYPNLTPDPETGHIYGWDEDTFLRRMRGGRVYKGSAMPWENYGRLTDEDIRSIYRFLRSLPPTRNVIGPPHRRVGEGPGAS